LAGGGDPGRYDDGVEHDLVFISHVQLRPRRGTRRLSRSLLKSLRVVVPVFMQRWSRSGQFRMAV